MAQTIFTISAGANDSQANASVIGYTNHNPTSTVSSAEKSNSVGSVALLKWDTLALPDAATVTSAVLRINVTSRSSANARNFTADWFTWNGTSGDWTATAATNAHAGTAITTLVVGDNDIALANVGNISLTGTTFLRCHVTGTIGGGSNFVDFTAFEGSTTLAARLVVDYSSAAGRGLLGGVGT